MQRDRSHSDRSTEVEHTAARAMRGDAPSLCLPISDTMRERNAKVPTRSKARLVRHPATCQLLIAPGTVEVQDQHAQTGLPLMDRQRRRGRIVEAGEGGVVASEAPTFVAASTSIKATFRSHLRQGSCCIRFHVDSVAFRRSLVS